MLPLTYQRVLIAADDALYSAAKARDGTSKKVYEKFTKAIHLLGQFKKDFPFRDPTLDPNIVTRVSQFPAKILHALETNLHAKVKFPYFFYLSTLMNPSQRAIHDRN